MEYLNTGKAFESKFAKKMRDDGYLVIRMPDYANSVNTGKAVCDFIVLLNGQVTFYELKHTNNKISFSLSLIKPHQVKSLLDIEAAGVKTCILIEDGDKNWYSITPTFVKDLILKGQKSFKFWNLTEVDK